MKQQPDNQVFGQERHWLLLQPRKPDRGSKAQVWLPGKEEEWWLQSSSQLQDVPAAWESTPRAAHPTHTPRRKGAPYLGTGIPASQTRPWPREDRHNLMAERQSSCRLLTEDRAKMQEDPKLSDPMAELPSSSGAIQHRSVRAQEITAQAMAHRAGCQHACIPHIPPHSHFSNTSTSLQHTPHILDWSQQPTPCYYLSHSMFFWDISTFFSLLCPLLRVHHLTPLWWLFCSQEFSLNFQANGFFSV